MRQQIPGDLLELPPRADRTLVVPTDARTSLVDAVVRPLLGTGSTVVVVGGTAADVARIAAQEKAV